MLFIPDYVLYAVDKLEAAGFECYFVGGCVRDALMGIAPHDFDLTTSALPDEMQRVFCTDRVIETGLKHGTLTVLSSGNPLEITTYRIDGEYDDNRHPREVSFTRNLRDDLARRDFTVNAMAMSRSGEIVDLFGGREDLKNGVIRSVGDARCRFEEDGLRIMRALRFSATLDFEIAHDTAAAIDSMCELLRGISVERINAELSKLLCGVTADKICLRFADTLSIIMPELGADLIRAFAKRLPELPNNLIIRRAAMLCMTESPMQSAASASRRLKLSNAERDLTVACVKLMTLKPTEKPIIAGYIDKLGFELTASALNTAGCPEAANAVMKLQSDGAPIRISELKINGEDVIALGVAGADIGKCLNKALTAVINGECENEKDSLINMIKSDCF